MVIGLLTVASGCRVMRLTLTDETILAVPVREVASEFPDISVGSYPVVQQADDAGVLISMEGKEDAQVQAAMDRLVSLMNSAAVACVLEVASNVSDLHASC